MKGRFFVKALKGVVFITLAVFVFGYAVVHLWNWLVPELFHGPMITYWQALGLLILSKIFFGGFRGHGWGGGGRCGHHGWHGHHHHWREKFEAKMSNMTPEEKEKFRQGWRNKCGWEMPGTEEKKEEN